MKETDSVAMFEEQVIIERKKPSYYEKVTIAYAEYTDYCKEVNYKPVGRNNFTKRMESIGFEKKKNNMGAFLKKHFLWKGSKVSSLCHFLPVSLVFTGLK